MPPPRENPQKIAFDTGRHETRDTLAGWRDERFRVVIGWALLSMGIALLLLTAALVVSWIESSRAVGAFVPLAVDPNSGAADFRFLLEKNFVVLLLHELVCFASYLARRAVPLQAQYTKGVNRWVHDHAGPASMVFVAGATVFSLALQARVLGGDLADAALTLDMSSAGLLARLCLHGIPELAAVFLPLAACLLLARRKAWNNLLAACVLCGLIAVPVIVASAAVEVWVTRLLF